MRKLTLEGSRRSWSSRLERQSAATRTLTGATHEVTAQPTTGGGAEKMKKRRRKLDQRSALRNTPSRDPPARDVDPAPSSPWAGAALALRAG
jgi:hypothetical protein